jgi:hypothetical protein
MNMFKWKANTPADGSQEKSNAFNWSGN